jgi:hypothetical protein
VKSLAHNQSVQSIVTSGWSGHVQLNQKEPCLTPEKGSKRTLELGRGDLYTMRMLRSRSNVSGSQRGARRKRSRVRSKAFVKHAEDDSHILALAGQKPYQTAELLIEKLGDVEE